MSNEIGTAPPRGRDVVDHDEAVRALSDVSGSPVQLPEDAVVTRGPRSCPACHGTDVRWGVSTDRTQAEIHPLVWHETEWMADTFLCGDCDAGWIEPDEPEPITWVRPYWIDNQP